jgi:tetratricopeptide (TPR) repeat protein
MKAQSSQRDIHTVTSLTQRVGTGVNSSSHWLASQRRFLSLMKAVRLVGGIFRTMLAFEVMLATGVSTYAQDIPGYPASLYAYDPREVAMLPRYCAYTQAFRDSVPGGNNPGEIQRWSSVLGETFHHMHHYCWGLMKSNRGVLLSRDEQSRRFYLNDSIAEFDYVIAHAPPAFVLLPEIFMKKGENLIRLGQHGSGILQLLRAIELRPDYWPPYAVMSDHYKNTGDLKNAREVLEKGLLASPDAKALKERLANLDAVKK